MRFTWKDYSVEYQDVVDSWQDEMVDEYGISFDSYHEDHEFYTIEKAEFVILNETYANKVVFDGDVPIGVIVFLVRRKPKYLSVPLVTINTIIIAPTHRNKGYGSAIIKEAIEYFGDILPVYKNVSCIFDSETEDHIAGQKTLERAGFVFAVRVEDDEDEWEVNWWLYPKEVLDDYKKERNLLDNQDLYFPEALHV